MASLLERGAHALGHGPLPQPLHGLSTHLEGFGDLGVTPLRSFWSRIGFEQDARLQRLPR